MTFLGEDIPKLGFGLMRLPHVDGKMENPIDIEQVKQMVDLFLDNGFSYFDTAYGYQGSEAAIKEALVDRYPRDSFLLATKLPAWAGPKNADEAKQMFYTSLERTGAGYFDFYLLHNIAVSRKKAFDDYDIWNFVQERKSEGLIKHVGFSFHDHADYLDEVLSEHPEIEFVQLQINYADWDDPKVESRACYEVAMKHGTPVVVMEPLRGGKLCNLPEPAAKVLEDYDPNMSPASWGLRFAASLPGVITVLSGMSNVQQMRDNIAITHDFSLEFTDEENQVLANVQSVLASIPHIPCTDCRYCMPDCPQQINIPGVFSAYNDYLVYNELGPAIFDYGFATMNGGKASKCLQCGRCEIVCTQGIAIIDELKKAADTLEKPLPMPE